MTKDKQRFARAALILITVLSACQRTLQQSLSDAVSIPAFICVTNLAGLIVPGIFLLAKQRRIEASAMKKGIILAFEMTGFNCLLLLGSRSTDTGITSGIAGMFFIFITPILLLLKRKVNFFSGVASVIAVLALLLMYGGDTRALYTSVNVIYLALANLCFAAYVVSVSILGKGESAVSLTAAQLIWSAILSGILCLLDSAVSGRSLHLPVSPAFWISAIFIGVSIRMFHSLVEIRCQQYVSAIETGLIFSGEILLHLLLRPLLNRIMGMEVIPLTGFQVIGVLLFIIAALMVNERIMVHFGYTDLLEFSYVTREGGSVKRSSVARKIIMTTLTFALVTLVLSAVIFLSSIYLIRDSAVSGSRELGTSASSISSQAMMAQLEEKLSNQVRDKTELAEQMLDEYEDAIHTAASYAHALYMDADAYPKREVPAPESVNEGKWVMQRTLANQIVSYQRLKAESALLGNMVDVFEPIIANSEGITSIYLGTADGLMVSYDPFSKSNVEQGCYEYRTSRWFTLGRDSKGISFTQPYQDGYGRGLTITCVEAFTDADNAFAGCVAMDIMMQDLNEIIVGSGILSPSEAMLIDNEGRYIAEKNADLTAENLGSVFDEGKSAVLRQMGSLILEQKNGVRRTGSGTDASYVAFSSIDSTGWILCIVCPVSAVTGPAEEIQRNIDANTNQVIDTVVRGIQNVLRSSFILTALILLFAAFFSGTVSRQISDPLKKLEADVRQISAGEWDRRTGVSTDDEIGSLANTFNFMTESLQTYIEELKERTAKEARIKGELAVATDIQASMLPHNFNAFSDCHAFELYASMTPAKEVGGDFYDFFMPDQNHLALVMADVSGKGVPAALFMVVTKTLIKNQAQVSISPADILTAVNHKLCENNEQDMFVTVWLGIMDIHTGVIKAANAGHEYPAIRRKGGRYELLKDKHGLACGAMEGIRYREYAITLEEGDSLFLYTDGVPEATNAYEKLFGTDRMLAALNEKPASEPEGLLGQVKTAVDAFVGDADQFDDLTMLAVTRHAVSMNAEPEPAARL